jgi:hypothetical protein
MRKWLVAAALTLVVVLAVAPLAGAGKGAGKGGGQAKGKAKFNLVGTVVAVAGDAESGTLTVDVKAGTKTVHEYRGDELTMTVDPEAKVRLVTGEGCETVELGDVPIDAKVKVRGHIDRSNKDKPKFIADFVQAKAPDDEAETATAR